MNQLVPLAIGSGFYGALFLFLPCFIKKGPNQGIIRCSIYLTVFSTWLFWAVVYVSQMNPLIGPKHKNASLIWLKRAEHKESKVNPDTSVKADDAAKDAASALRMRPQHCINQPDNLFHCCNIPWLPKTALDKCMEEPVNVLTVTCDQARCAFEAAGWLDGSGSAQPTAVLAYYDEVVKFKPEWDLAMGFIKSECLETKPEYQGKNMTCPEYDIIYCAVVKMFKHSPLSTWSTAAACVPTRQFTESCPICPESCNHQNLKDPSMLACQACYMIDT